MIRTWPCAKTARRGAPLLRGGDPTLGLGSLRYERWSPLTLGSSSVEGAAGEEVPVDLADAVWDSAVLAPGRARCGLRVQHAFRGDVCAAGLLEWNLCLGLRWAGTQAPATWSSPPEACAGARMCPGAVRSCLRKTSPFLGACASGTSTSRSPRQCRGRVEGPWIGAAGRLLTLSFVCRSWAARAGRVPVPWASSSARSARRLAGV